MSIIIVYAELETSFNRTVYRYEMKPACEALKAVNSFMTTMILYYLYDYYDYQVAGAKKEWYKKLYQGENTGPMPTFGLYFPHFLGEFLLLSIHCVPYADFRFWKDQTGLKKPFISDKLNALCMLRLYTVVRVIRDYTPIY